MIDVETTPAHLVRFRVAIYAGSLEPSTVPDGFPIEVAVLMSIGRNGMKNVAVFPISRHGQRNGSRASVPSEDGNFSAGAAKGSGHHPTEVILDHSLHTPLTRPEFTEAMLIGAPIYGADDDTVGTISHLHGTGAGTQVVIDVGGFLGIGAKPVLISIDQLNMMRNAAGHVHGRTLWTRQQLHDLPLHQD